MLCNLIRLPHLEWKSQALVAIIIIVCLILVVFYSNEIGMDGFRVEGKGYEGVDSGSLRNDLDGPRLEYICIVAKGKNGNVLPVRSWIGSFHHHSGQFHNFRSWTPLTVLAEQTIDLPLCIGHWRRQIGHRTQPGTYLLTRSTVGSQL